MSRNFQGIGFGVPAELVTQLDDIASKRQVSRSEAARTAIGLGIPLLRLGVALDTQRALTIMEHTQVAVSYLVERHSREDAADLLELAMRNVRDFHG